MKISILNNILSTMSYNIYFGMKLQDNPTMPSHHHQLHQQIKFHLLHRNFIFGRLVPRLGFPLGRCNQ